MVGENYYLGQPHYTVVVPPAYGRKGDCALNTKNKMNPAIVNINSYSFRSGRILVILLCKIFGMETKKNWFGFCIPLIVKTLVAPNLVCFQ